LGRVRGVQDQRARNRHRPEFVDPETLPDRATAGRKVELSGATDDNPYGVVVVSRKIIVTGGTRKVYLGPLEGDPGPMPALEPIFEVKSGVTGLAVDPKTGAVYGSPQEEGAVIRLVTSGEIRRFETVARGFHRLVDVAFTPNGTLLALEFG